MTYRPLHDTYYDCPKIKKLARRLSIDIRIAHASISLLWTWALRHAPDGDLSRYDDEDIEDALYWDGEPGALVQTMADCRLLDQADKGTGADSGYAIHNWLEHGGTYAESKRKQALRKKKKQMSQDVPGHDGTSRDVPNREEKRREEKRRKEKKEPEPAESAAEATGLFAQQDKKIGKIERSDINEVYQHYRTYHPAAPAVLKSTRKEYKLIRERLTDFPVDRLKLAIDGYHRSPWHTGQNKRQTKYLSLELMMRDIGHVQSGLEFAGTASDINNQPRRLDGLKLLGDTGD